MRHANPQLLTIPPTGHFVGVARRPSDGDLRPTMPSNGTAALIAGRRDVAEALEVVQVAFR